MSTGDVLREPYKALSGRDWLGFAGIASAQFPAVSPEEQFAEKPHACTLPRVGRENTRVKDLIDLVLLIERTKLDAARLPRAIRETFPARVRILYYEFPEFHRADTGAGLFQSSR